MIWYLIVCSGLSATQVCLPAQRMPDMATCVEIRRSYKQAARYVFAQCRGVRKP